MGLKVFRIDENTWRIEDGMVRMFLLKGDKKALLIDSGVSGADVKTLCESLVDVPVELINTHADRDHIASNHFFEKFYIHSDDAGQMDPCKVVCVSDQDVLDLGNRLIQVIHIPGHTLGSIALLDTKMRVLYSGDSVQDGHIYMFGPHRRCDMFSDSLKKLMTIEDKFDWIYASHGTFTLEKDYVREVDDVYNLYRKGQVNSMIKVLHGKEILCVTHKNCGFYFDK